IGPRQGLFCALRPPGLCAEGGKSALDGATLFFARGPIAARYNRAGRASFLSLEPTIANAPEVLAAQTGELTPTATQTLAALARRRRIFSALCLLTLISMGIWLGTIL